MVFYFLKHHIQAYFLAGLKSQSHLFDLYHNFIRLLQVLIAVLKIQLVQKEELKKLSKKEKSILFELLNIHRFQNTS